MLRATNFVLIVIVCTSVCAGADSRKLSEAEAGFGGPLAGYLLDSSTRRIRALTGTPGAAVVGPALLEMNVDKALIPGDGSFAVVVVPKSPSLGYIQPVGSSEPRWIEGSMSSFEQGALSAAGTTAIVFSPSCGCVQVVTDLRAEPRVSQTISLTRPSGVQAVAINDSGSIFAVAYAPSAEGDPASLLIHSSDNEMPSALPIHAFALAFSPDGNRLAVADRDRKLVLIVEDPMRASNITEIASEKDGLAAPAALRFLTDSRLVVADAGGRVHLVDSEGGPIRTVECPCVPTAVEAMTNTAMFRISGMETGAAWIVDTSGERLQPMFIPVPKENSAPIAGEAR